VEFNKSTTLMWCGADKKALSSNPRFAMLLRDYGVEPPMKISPATGELTYAFAKTDEGFKELLEHPNIAVQTLAAARIGSKSTLEETRTKRFIDISFRGPMPVPLSYCAAQTLRYGGADGINLQNIPRGSLLKKAIKPPPGYVYLDSDLSAVEARVLAWFAGQEDLVRDFENKAPIYESMAADIYGVPVANIKKGSTERQAGKTTILQSGYGSGGPKLQTTLRNADTPVYVSDEEADNIIRIYRAKYPRIPELWKQAERAIEAMATDCSAPVGKPGILSVEGHKGIKTPSGLYLRYENLRKHKFNDGKVGWAYDVKKGPTVVAKKIYGAALVGHICQHLSSCIIAEQMLRISQRY
jgi:DNA polymerase